jgi:hypothetical protein
LAKVNEVTGRWGAARLRAAMGLLRSGVAVSPESWLIKYPHQQISRSVSGFSSCATTLSDPMIDESTQRPLGRPATGDGCGAAEDGGFPAQAGRRSAR